MLHKRLTELEEWLRVCYYRRGENQLPTVLRVNNARSTTSTKEITEQKKRFRSLLGWKSPTIKIYARKKTGKKVQQ